MTDAVSMPDPSTDAVKEMAHFILAFVEGSPVGYLAAIHAATIVITSMAIEEPDPQATLDELLGEMRAEARAMISTIGTGAAHDA